ncbi:MAG: FAD-dependent monooxygenase [Labrys sp. (in: a-proteobacteria)]
METISQTRTSVLIVGGGLTGLTAAALLAHRGIGCLVVERHAGTSIQYKFTGISPRSMEIFRSIGLEDEIRAERTGDQQGGGIARAKNLADPDIQWSDLGWPDASPFSPTQPATCDQHVLEPILRRHAERHGAEIRFGRQLEVFEEGATGARAHIRNLASGEEEVVLADYVIAADGANGGLRERLGIGRSGPGSLQHWISIIFDTNLPPILQGRRFTSCFITDLNGTITPRAGGRWLLALQYFPQKGERPADFDAVRCRELAICAAGRPGIKAEPVDIRAWEVAAAIADRFREGRAFLVGDAAHLMPPTGAFGGNTGIHDAHNLAWKLAMVLKGEADPRLLDSYDAERRPIVQATLAQALARLQSWFKDPSKRLPPAVPVVPDYDVVLGQRLEAGAFPPAGLMSSTPFESHATLAANPGTRAPHLWLERDGQRLSSLDLFGKGLVLLASKTDWRQAAEEARRRLDLPLACEIIGAEGDIVDIDDRWPAAYRLDPDGAVLVRPDGFVAWRSSPDESKPDTLYAALRCLGMGMTGNANQVS